MSSFDRLTPAMQYQISNTLGFKELREVQTLTIDTVLDGKNCVVLAPTAGGKTEAAFFPILSAMDAEDWKPVSVLYLSPIRALLNNQDARVARYAETIGRRSFTWHGDTGQPARKKFLKEPADILLTTPESLEAMLMSAKVPAARLFAGLRAVIIDEVHAFAADDRGAHLAALLERLVKFCGSDIQRIGLSATVGNPEDILTWVQGSSRRAGEVVRPHKPRVQPDLSLDYVASMANAAQVIAQLHRGKKRLVFVDSRRGAEELATALRGLEVDTFLIHGSLAVSERKEAERAFAERTNCVIVATSALELGIDVGDLDHVLQIDSPITVASFLQRMGRTGRRGGLPNCTFLATKKDGLLQAAGLLRLYQTGFVEPVRPSRRAFHILAHQIMALTIQREGVRRGEWFAWLDGATPFAGMTAEDRSRVLDHMLEADILSDQDGVIGLGAVGEKKYGKRNFLELYAVFSTPRSIVVHWGQQEIGTVDVSFLEQVLASSGQAAFALGGRPWEILDVDWKKGMCDVRPSDQANAARWGGKGGRFLSYELTQAMREVLVTETVDPWWSKRASAAIAELRSDHAFLADEPSPVITDADGTRWWSFAGGSANLLLARMLEETIGGRCAVTNKYVTWTAEGRDTTARFTEGLRQIAQEGRPTRDDAIRFAAAAAARMPISKFEACLPQGLLDEYVAAMLDVTAAQRAVRREPSQTASASPSE